MLILCYVKMSKITKFFTKTVSTTATVSSCTPGSSEPVESDESVNLKRLHNAEDDVQHLNKKLNTEAFQDHAKTSIMQRKIFFNFEKVENISKIHNERNSVSVLLELIEVSIHCILYARKIYPEGIFELKKKYNVPVHVSIYPKLNSYINGTLNAVKSLLKLKKLCKLDVCFYNKIGVVVERFVINIRNVELELNLSDFSNLRDPYLIKLEQMLRAFCLKLTVCDSLLKPLPSSCTFQIHIHTTETNSIEIQKDTEEFPLIPSEKKNTIITSPAIVPMRSIDCEHLNLEIYAEEGNKDEDPDLFTQSPLI